MGYDWIQVLGGITQEYELIIKPYVDIILEVAISVVSCW